MHYTGRHQNRSKGNDQWRPPFKKAFKMPQGSFSVTSTKLSSGNIERRSVHVHLTSGVKDARKQRFKADNNAPLRLSPACGRSTSCTASPPGRRRGLPGSSTATGWSHRGARGSDGRSGSRDDSTGSSNRARPGGCPAPDPQLSVGERTWHCVTITNAASGAQFKNIFIVK